MMKPLLISQQMHGYSMDFDKLKTLLRLNEGVRTTPYKCSEGFWTVGVGHNLDVKPLSMEAVEQILDDDLKDCIKEVTKLGVWEGLDEVRQAVLIDMCFNLGFVGLCKFKKMFAAMVLEDYDEAAKEMLNSRWARQVGDRAFRLERMMARGEWF